MVTVLLPEFQVADDPLDTVVPFTEIATVAPFAPVAVTVSVSLLVDAEYEVVPAANAGVMLRLPMVRAESFAAPVVSTGVYTAWYQLL